MNYLSWNRNPGDTSKKSGAMKIQENIGVSPWLVIEYGDFHFSLKTLARHRYITDEFLYFQIVPCIPMLRAAILQPPLSVGVTYVLSGEAWFVPFLLPQGEL